MNKTPISGVTLVEAILVMAVASSIIMIAMKQARIYRNDNDINQVLHDVDEVFQGASYFYQANCKMQADPVTGPIGGTGVLDPKYFPAPPATPTPTPPSNPYPVTIAQLKSGGFLTNKVAFSPIVNTSAANDGFIVQFNQDISDRSFSTSAPVTTIKLGKIIMWQIQVAVLLRNPAKALVYGKLLGADCLSTVDPSGTTVTPCSSAPPGLPTPPVYAVWSRLPSYATPASNSNQWISNADRQVFNQLYETYPVSVLQNVPASSYPQQNYLCGS
jgi:hypothetical protein